VTVAAPLSGRVSRRSSTRSAASCKPRPGSRALHTRMRTPTASGSRSASRSRLRSIGQKVSCRGPRTAPPVARVPARFRDRRGRRGAARRTTVFTFDCATLGRFGERRAEVERASIVVNIDHHLSNTAFGTINLVDAAASATGQVIYSRSASWALRSAPRWPPPVRRAVHGHRRLPAREHHRGVAPPGAALVAAEPTPMGRAQELQVALPGAGAAGRPRHRPDAFRDERAPALVEVTIPMLETPAQTCRTPRASSTRSRASIPCNRDPLQAAHRRPQQDQRSHPRAHRRHRGLHAVRRRRPPARSRRRVRGPAAIAERRVLEVARRLIDATR